MRMSGSLFNSCAEIQSFLQQARILSTGQELRKTQVKSSKLCFNSSTIVLFLLTFLRTGLCVLLELKSSRNNDGAGCMAIVHKIVLALSAEVSPNRSVIVPEDNPQLQACEWDVRMCIDGTWVYRVVDLHCNFEESVVECSKTSVNLVSSDARDFSKADPSTKLPHAILPISSQADSARQVTRQLLDAREVNVSGRAHPPKSTI